VDKQPVGVTEAKKETLGHNITTVEDQTKDYADAKLKWVQHTGKPLPFLYEATGVLTRFTDQRGPKPSVPFKDLAMEVVMGATDADTISSLAGRLARIERMPTPEQKQAVAEKLGGTAISTLIKNLFHAIDGEAIEQKALELTGQQPGTEPGDFAREKAQRELVAAAAPLTGAAVKLIVETCTANLQTIDLDTQDTLVRAEWDADARERSEAFVADFETFCREHQDQLAALTLFYQQPQRRQEVTLAQIKDVLAALEQAAPRLAPLRVWEAYAGLDALPENAAPLTELTALMALIRRACGIDGKLTPFPETVRRNFQTWIMRRHAGVPTEKKFTETQTAFLQLIRDHVMTSFRFERDDLDYAPFDAQGGLGKMHQLFGDQMDALIEELNAELVA
jgi:type I restriction enzyme R subunit